MQCGEIQQEALHISSQQASLSTIPLSAKDDCMIVLRKVLENSLNGRLAQASYFRNSAL